MENKNNKYVIFFDIDGTLVGTSEKVIAPEVVDELKRIKAQGHILAISTGRSLKTTEELNNVDVFDYLAVLMGSIVKDMHDPEHIKTFDQLDIKTSRKLIDFLESHNYHWTYKDNYTDKTTSEFASVQPLFRSELVTHEQMEQDLENHRVNQILVCSIMPEEEIRMFPEVNILPMPGDYMDITSKTSTKANAVNYIKSLYKGYTSVAVGDSLNDLDMFKSVDIPIAMGNANDETKSHAKYVTKDINNGGIIYAMRNILHI